MGSLTLMDLYFSLPLKDAVRVGAGLRIPTALTFVTKPFWRAEKPTHVIPARYLVWKKTIFQQKKIVQLLLDP